MRILHLDSGQEMRGGQWQVLRLVEGLGGRLLCPKGSPLFDRARSAGLDVRPLNLFSIFVESGRADLVHAHDARSHTFAALASRAPIVVARRVSFPVRSRWKYGRAAHFIAVSEYVKGILVDRGITADRISVVYDGVPDRPLVPGGNQVSMLASEDPMKAVALGQQACAAADVALHTSEDLDRLLADALCLLYLSYSEGLGSGALAAMSAGVPVIASRLGGLPEIIDDGKDGILVENEAAAVAGAIRFLIDNRALARLMGTHARQKIQERFSVEQMVRNTRAVYEQVLA